VTSRLIVSDRAEDLIGALRVLSDCGVALETRDVVNRALAEKGDAEQIILFLTERDNLADLRLLLSSSDARFLLFAPTSPPRAPLARVARQYGASLGSCEDPSAVREATLVAFAAAQPEHATA
jgi:hypothetical protein